MSDLSLELIRGIQIVNDAIPQTFVALLENGAFLSDGIIDLGAALIGVKFSEETDTLRWQARLFQQRWNVIVLHDEGPDDIGQVEFGDESRCEFWQPSPVRLANAPRLVGNQHAAKVSESGGQDCNIETAAGEFGGTNRVSHGTATNVGCADKSD